jgi:mannosyltransferase
VPQALSDGRFDGISRVWLVEYALPTHIDTYGLASLEQAGFTVDASYRTHRSDTIELSRGVR